MKYNTKINVILILVVLIFIINIVILITIFNKDSNDYFDAVDSERSTLEVVDETTLISLETEHAEILENNIDIYTPFCVLSFPESKSNDFRYETIEAEGVYTMRFFCNINGQEYNMYNVYFCKAEIGIYIGDIMVDDNKIQFCVESFDMPDEKNQNEEHVVAYYSMMDSINTVIQSVKSSHNFIN